MIVTRTCRLCGEDCATRPRIKDPRGRYYCTDCYETARRRRTDRVSPPPDPDPPPGGRLNAFADDRGGIAPCPNCTRLLAATDVICPACGLNRRTGRCAATRVELAPRPQTTSTIHVWPWVIGGISLLMGGAQAGMQLLAGVGALRSSNPASDTLWGLLVSSVFFLIALQLLLGGVNILRRLQIGVGQACLWARIQLVLCLLGAILLGLAAAASRHAGLGLESSVGLGFAWLGVAALWPIILLAWFARPAIQEEISREWG